MTRSVVLLGSTGSIGTQTLDIVEANPGAFRVTGIAASGSRPELLADQAAKFGVATVAVADTQHVGDVRAALADRGARDVEVIAGADAATDMAGSRADIVVNGISGSVGLAPTLAALAAGSRLALANKESLVAGGDLVMSAAAPGQIVPVDSEHSAMAQAMRAGKRDEVSRLILTASGGPFRGRTRDELTEVTAAQALAHPTWSMGPVVTINSATLMNKALELIEAQVLFDMDPDRITVVVHPQSIVHSAVEFFDGSTIAQVSPPDMRLPIAVALGWPDRVADAIAPNAWDAPVTWTFEPLDDDTFPAITLARAAAAASGWHTASLGAANEVAVDRFRRGSLSFLGITRVVEDVLAAVDSQVSPGTVPADLADVLAIEHWARVRASEHPGT